MNIQLKNISHQPRLSEETECYTASLYVDGKKIGQVSNRGHGGPDMFTGDRAAYDKADAWCQANLPGSDLGDGDEMPTDLELHCADLLNDWLCMKELKSHMRSKVLMVGEGQIRTFTFPGCRKVNQRHIDAVAAKYPAAKFLNSMEADAALKVFKEMS